MFKEQCVFSLHLHSIMEHLLPIPTFKEVFFSFVTSCLGVNFTHTQLKVYTYRWDCIYLVDLGFAIPSACCLTNRVNMALIGNWRWIEENFLAVHGKFC